MVTLVVLAVLLGLWLALRLERSLRRVTGAVYAIAGGDQPDSLPQQDIAEIDAVYRAVNTLVDRLETLENARRRLLANLVHELGRPLGSLRAAVDALRHGADADPDLHDELLVGMNDQIARMQPLLEDLTRLHSQVLGTLDLHLEPTPLSQWLPKVMTLWRHAAGEKGITWRADIPLDLPSVPIDSDQLGRALGNLFSNGIKYTPEGGSILVEAGVTRAGETETRDACWIRIGDSGPGIPADEQAMVFEPFQRGASDRRFPQGMGLGLAIAQDIVVAHGGRIDLESRQGMGSRFTVTLPLAGSGAL
jgi:two-component system sensor histidine kinase BaeS